MSSVWFKIDMVICLCPLNVPKNPVRDSHFQFNYFSIYLQYLHCRFFLLFRPIYCQYYWRCLNTKSDRVWAFESLDQIKIKYSLLSINLCFKFIKIKIYLFHFCRYLQYPELSDNYPVFRCNFSGINWKDL